MPNKSFTPITLLQSELKQWRADLKYSQDQRYLNDVSNGTDQRDKLLKKQIEQAKRKIMQFETAIKYLKGKKIK